MPDRTKRKEPHVLLSRAQIGRDVTGIDVTVRGQDTYGRHFAPTWALVLDHKAGRITNEEYAARYLKLLEDRYNDDPWTRTAVAYLHQYGRSRNDRAVLLCYCRDGVFCHTHLLMKWLIERHPDLFDYNRG